jgi:hypothetical protein
VPETNQNPEGSANRRIILSSARALEVLRYHLEHNANRGLHLCAECNSPLVQPVEWHEGRAGFWELTLRCPNCRRQTEGLYSQRQVDAFEEELEDGLAQMLADLGRLTQANMAEEVDRFATALRSELILPEDF